MALNGRAGRSYHPGRNTASYEENHRYLVGQCMGSLTRFTFLPENRPHNDKARGQRATVQPKNFSVSSL